MRWCLTLNNYTDVELQKLKSLEGKVKYGVFGKEVAPTTLTPHIQGFFILSKIMRIGTVKSLLGIQRVHLEISRAKNVHDAINYCKKDGDFWEIGEPPKTKNESGGEKLNEMLLAAKESIDSGMKEYDLYQNHFVAMMRAGKQLKEYMGILKKEKKPPRVELLWGTPGTGKTRYAHFVADVFYEGDLWTYPGKGWFDGYIGQRVALFDDFYGDIEFGMLMRVLDRYKTTVPIKGGHVEWVPERIFITSNVWFHSWYKDIQASQVEALVRRIHKIEYIDFNIFD